MISYAKLWMLLKAKGMKKTDLLEVVSAPTLTKLGKNENINVSMIEKICEFLNCQPGDIMEYVSEKKVQQVVEQFGMLQQVMIDSLKEQGIKQEDLATLMGEAIPKYMESIYKGENPMEDMINEAIKKTKDSE